MAVTYSKYGKLGKHLATGNMDLIGGTVKVVLLSSTYAPNLDTHEFRSDLTNELATANGYTVGGATIANRALGTYDSTNDRTPITCDNTVWTATAGGITARYAAVFRDTGTAATSPLVSLVDFGADVTATSGAFTIDWNDTGGLLSV